MRRYLLAALVLISACAPIRPNPGNPTPTLPHAVAIEITSSRGLLAGASVKLAQGGPEFTCTTNDAGYCFLGDVPFTTDPPAHVDGSDWRVWITKDGCDAYSELVYLKFAAQIIRVGKSDVVGSDIALPVMNCTPPRPAFGGAVHIAGKFFTNNNGVFRPVLASGLSILSPSKPRDAFLDWIVAQGFDGIRVFAGNLTFDGATAAQARDALPGLLDAVRSRNLWVEVTALTDTASMSKDDIRNHVRAIAQMCAGHEEVFGIEIGNELYHPTQNSALTDTGFLNELKNIIRQAGFTGPIAYGAAQDDESTQFSGGDYTTIHLDRGRPAWNQVRRIREMQNVVDATGKPALDNERTGAAEPGTPGQRISDVSWFFCAGALDRLFEVPGVFHFEDGLHINMPVGPTQTQAATAYIQGFRIMDQYVRGGRSTYQNSNGHGGWASSPVQNFNESRAARAYAGVNGANGGIVIVGSNDSGVVNVGAGWTLTGQALGMQGVGSEGFDGGCRVMEVVH
jgi:hypothetical protein